MEELPKLNYEALYTISKRISLRLAFAEGIC